MHSTQSQNGSLQGSEEALLAFQARPFYDWGKRLGETLIALVVLVGLAPLWAILALLIKITSPGPVLFRGRVVGQGGREFTYYKFRSMRHNNDNSQHKAFIERYVKQASASPADGSPQFKLTNDGRVTSVGRFIRKFSLDEVPQLINVVRGEMAIVGPRPPVPYEFALYDDWCKQRLLVLPGITGLAQVKARGTASFNEMVALDFEYIQQRSLSLDWQIMLKTPLVMLKGA